MTQATAPVFPPCPRCGSSGVVEIVYGLPGGEAVAAEQRDEIVLGGCLVGDESPDYVCRACDEPLPWARSAATRRVTVWLRAND